MDVFLMADGGTASVSKATPAADRARDEALQWFDELRDPVRRYLMCAGACPADADEAVQECFLRLYVHLSKDGDRSNVRAWVFQVARNYLRDERKSARRRRTIPLDDAMESDGRFRDPGGSPEQCALRGEQERRMREAAEKLPRQQRECVLLRAAGLRYREIAVVMGIPTASVGALVQRAVTRLNEDLA